MGVLTCNACGERVNDQAAACPNCGLDPRLSQDEIVEERARRQQVLEERRAERIAGASGSDRHRLLKKDPVAYARHAKEAGFRVLHLELPLPTIDASAEEAINADGTFLLDAIEREGWTLDSWRVVYQPTGVSSLGGSIGGVGVGVNKIEGATVYHYLFRRSKGSD